MILAWQHWLVLDVDGIGRSFRVSAFGQIRTNIAAKLLELFENVILLKTELLETFPYLGSLSI